MIIKWPCVCKLLFDFKKFDFGGGRSIPFKRLQRTKSPLVYWHYQYLVDSTMFLYAMKMSAFLNDLKRAVNFPLTIGGLFGFLLWMYWTHKSSPSLNVPFSTSQEIYGKILASYWTTFAIYHSKFTLGIWRISLIVCLFCNFLILVNSVLKNLYHFRPFKEIYGKILASYWTTFAIYHSKFTLGI